MHSYMDMVSFVSIVTELHLERPRVQTCNKEFQASPPRAFCSPFLFLYREVDERFLSNNPPFKSFCDWGAGTGITIKYMQHLWPQVESYGVEKDIDLINKVKDTGHAPHHGNCITWSRTADINYTFNITWDQEFKKRMLERIMILMKPGQILIEAYDYHSVLRSMFSNSDFHLLYRLLNPEKERYPYTIVRKV